MELTPGRGGQMGRSAGTAIQLMAKEGKHATLRLPSGEMRMVPVESRRSARSATPSTSWSSSARPGARHPRRAAADPAAWRGAVDHPHEGGGLHHTPGGHPRTPWGVPTLGYRTRKKKKASSQLIVRGRPAREEGQAMSRSSKKGPFVEGRLLRRIEQMNESGSKQMVKTWSRASIFQMVGHTIADHDGRKHVPVFISESMVSHKLGEFAPTRVFRAHAGSDGEVR